MSANIEICPTCHTLMKAISERKGGFSGGKAALGAVIAGPIGIAAGALGKKSDISVPKVRVCDGEVAHRPIIHIQQPPVQRDRGAIMLHGAVL